MSTIKQVLQQASQSREPKSPNIYRRGRVTNSAAYYRGVKADPEAGRINATAAKFLQDIAQPLGKIAGERKKEFAEAERNAGIASFTRATPEQREKMRNAIKAGIISESESPYFREGVSIAYTKSLLGKYNQDLFQKYEEWKGKNDEDSGSFDKFLDEFDGGYAANFETIHEDILTEHFIPGQMGIRRQLQQRHTEHLNKNYRQKAFGLKEAEFFEILKGYPEDLVKEMLNNPTTGVKRLVERGRDGNTQDLDRMTLVTTILNSDTITKEQREQLSQFPDGQQLLKDLDALQGKKEKTKSVVPTSIETGKKVGPDSVLQKEVKKKKKPTSTDLKNEPTLMELGNMSEEEKLNLSIDVFYKDGLEGLHGFTKSTTIGNKKGQHSSYFGFVKKTFPKIYKGLDAEGRNHLKEYMELVNKVPATGLKAGQNIKFNPAHFISWRKRNKQ